MSDLGSVIYADGDAFFDKLEKRFVRHAKGLFILTPSGAGKTHFCKRQKEQNWIDGDKLYLSAGVHPDKYEWWKKGVHVINRVEQRCDVITAEAIDRGFWVMSSVNYWLKPSALVVPSLDRLKEQIQKREQENYDGGLKEEDWEQLIIHIGIIRHWSMIYGVPEFKSINEAVDKLTRGL